MNEKMQLLSRGLILFYCIACTGLIVLGYWLFPFVFGKSFNNMYWPFLFLVPAILSYSVTHLLTAYYGGKKVLSVNFWGNVFALALIVIGDVIFIPSYGIKGAAIVSSVGYLCYMSYMMFAHTREYKSRFADFLFFRKSDWQLLQKILADKFLLRKQENS